MGFVDIPLTYVIIFFNEKSLIKLENKVQKDLKHLLMLFKRNTVWLVRWGMILTN